MKNNELNLFSIVCFLFKYSPLLFVFSIFCGLISGALYGAVIPLVLHGMGMNDEGSFLSIAGFDKDFLITIFLVLCFAIFLTKTLSIILVNNMAKSASADLKIWIAEKINKMMVSDVEKVGVPRLINMLNDDILAITLAALAIPKFLVLSLSVGGVLTYLAWLNINILLLIIFFIFIGASVFFIMMNFALRRYVLSAPLKDVLQGGVRGMLLGLNELKLSDCKAKNFISDSIIDPQKKILGLEKGGDNLINFSVGLNDLIVLIAIGFICFSTSEFIFNSKEERYGAILVLLYISGPISSIYAYLQQVKQGVVSLTRINCIHDYKDELLEVSLINQVLISRWSVFSLIDVGYAYDEDFDGFALSPVSLSFLPGQINFIVGGNGSGKSTLAKIISTHYKASCGEMYFDDRLVDESCLLSVRDKIGVIFSDFHLFSRIYSSHINEEKIHMYLERFSLSDRVEYIDGRFSNINLSDGQRRRLALLVALVEDKDIYVFDEWAADQDPEFKRFFYEEILGEMKKNNKLIIAITHDDRYFYCADRVIYMEDGKISKIV